MEISNDALLKISISFLLIIFAVVLHEVTHYLTFRLLKIRVKYVFITWWSGFGFMTYNEDWLERNLKLVIYHLSPQIWCLLVLIDPTSLYFWIFPLVNILGGIIDMTLLVKILAIPPAKRIQRVNQIDEKIIKSMLWKRRIA